MAKTIKRIKKNIVKETKKIIIGTKKETKGILALGNNFINKWWNSFSKASSLIGFIMGQFVWIYILKGFLGWFVLWFCEVTEYQIGDVFKLTNVFWIIYGAWFFMVIVSILTEKDDKDK